ERRRSRWRWRWRWRGGCLAEAVVGCTVARPDGPHRQSFGGTAAAEAREALRSRAGVGERLGKSA
ncbi:MAG: hypothetical protein ACPG61_06760, partial [Paracoccaceae bacterium]